jgi:hypothetical protein
MDSWKDKRRIFPLPTLWIREGSCLEESFAGLSKLAIHANLPIYLANHATCASQRFLIIRHRKKMMRVTFGVEDLHSCAPRLRGVRPRFMDLTSRGRLSTFPLSISVNCHNAPPALLLLSEGHYRRSLLLRNRF